MKTHNTLSTLKKAITTISIVLLIPLSVIADSNTVDKMAALFNPSDILTLSKSSIVMKNGQTRKEIWLQNHIGAAVAWHLSQGSPVYSIYPESGTIQPHGRVKLCIEAASEHPPIEGMYQHTFFVLYRTLWSPVDYSIAMTIKRYCNKGVAYRFHHADDSVSIYVDGKKVASSDHTGLNVWGVIPYRYFASDSGNTDIPNGHLVEVKVFNKESYRGGLWGELQGKREGWRYRMEMALPGERRLELAGGRGKNIPNEEFGRSFTVEQIVLQRDCFSGSLNFNR